MYKDFIRFHVFEVMMSQKMTKAELMQELQTARERIAELESVLGSRFPLSQDRKSQQFSALIANAKDLVVVIDQQAKITFASPASEYILGYLAEEMVGRDIREAIHPDDMPSVNESFESRSRTPGTAPESIKVRALHKNGEWRIVEALGTNMFDDPAVQGIILNCRDITEQERAAAKMRESQERFRSIYENSPVAIFEEDFSKVKVYLDGLKAKGVVDLNEYINEHPDIIEECVRLVSVTDVNRAGLQLYEVESKADLLGGLERAVFPEEYEIFKDELVTVFEGETGYHSESVLIFPHGYRRNLIVQWTVVPGYEQTYSKVLVSLHDITERKQMEAALAESERRLRQAQDVARIGDWELDVRTGAMTLSKTMFMLLERDPLSGQPSMEEVLSCFLPKDAEETRAYVQRAIQTGQAWENDVRVVFPDGRTSWHHGMGFALKDDNGDVVRLYGVTQDITGRKEVEIALRTSERTLRLFVEHSPAAIAMLDRNMHYIVASRRYNEDYGLGAQNLVGRSHYEVFPEIPERWKQIHQRCLNGAVARAEEDPFIRSNGRLDWVHWEVHPWYEGANNVGGIIIFSEVITARKVAAERLRESEERYHQFVSQSFEGIMRVEFDEPVDVTLPPEKQIDHIYQNAYLAEVNQSMAEIYHTPLDWFIGSRLADIDDMRKGKSDYKNTLKRLIEDEYSSINEEVVEYGAGGKQTWLLRNIVGTVENGKLVRLWVTAIDITDRVLAEKARSESEEKYRTLINSTSDGVFVAQDEKFVFSNASLPGMLGYTAEEFENIPFEQVVAPDHLEIWLRRFNQRIQGENVISTYQTRFLDKTRTNLIWVELRANRINYGGRPAVLGIVRDITEQKKILEQIENLAKFPAESPGPVMRITRDGRLLYANEACFSLLTEWILEIGSQAPETLFNVAMLTFETGQDKTIEVVHGRRIITLDFILLKRGEYINIYGRDITEQREAEERLRQSEKRFFTIFENSPVAIGIARLKDSVVTDVNPALLELLGHSREETVGHTVRELNLFYDLKDYEELSNQLERRGYLDSFESAIRPASDERRDVLLSAEIIDIGGDASMLIQLTDITGRKKMEEELRFANQRFTELADHVSDVFWVFEPEMRQNLYLSPAFPKIIGVDGEDAANAPRRFIDVILQEDRHILEEGFDLQRGGFKTDLKYRIVRPDGSIRWIHDKGTPILDEKGDTIRVVGIASDITDQVDAERRVAENIQEVFWMFDYGQKKLVYVSPAFETIWGYSLQSLHEDNGLFAEGIHPEDRGIMFDALEKQARGEHTEIEYRVIRPDNSINWVRDRSFPVYDHETGDLIRTTGIIVDITERKLANEALKNSEERLRLSLSAAHQGLYDLNIQTGETITNREYAEMLGYDPETFVETNQKWIDRLHPDDKEAAVRAYRNYIDGIAPEYRVECRQKMKDGGWKWILSVGRVIEYDIEGRPLRMLGTHTDIEPLKQAEVELQKRAAQMSLLNDVGRKIAGVLDIQGVLDLSARLVHESFGYHHVGIFTLDAEKEELVMRVKYGKFAPLFPETHHIKLGTGIVGTVGRSGQMVLANQTNQHEDYINFFPEKLDTLSELGLPIKVAEKVVGVLDVQSPLPNAFNIYDIQVLQTLVDQIAIAIENASLYESVQRELAERTQAEKERQLLIRDLGERVKELTLLHQASRLLQNLHISEVEVLKSLVEVMPSAWQYPEIAVARIVAGGYVIASQGFMETEWMQSATFELPNGQSGKIELAYLKEPPVETDEPFLAEERNLLEILAERLQSAMTRQSMERELHRHTEELAHLLEAGRALTETLDLQSIYPIIYQYISAEMPCDLLYLSSYDPKSELITCEYFYSRDGSQDVSNFPPVPLDPPGHGAQSLVIRSGESILLSDNDSALQTASAQPVDMADDAERIRSAIIVPLWVNGVVAGALQVLSTRMNAYTQDQLRFVETLAFHISAALSNARLFSELEERVRQRTAEVHDLYDNAPTGYHSLDAAGNLVLINQTELDWLGYTREEMIGRNMTEFLTPESIKVFQESFPAFIRNGSVNDLELEVRRKDGAILPILVNATVVKDENGNFLASRSTILDNTERKKAEAALREREEIYRALFENANDAIFLIEPETGLILGANPHASELLGAPQDYLIGKNALEFIVNTQRDDSKKYKDNLLQEEILPIYERTFVRKDGTQVEAEINLSTIRDETGQPKMIQSVVRDISARKRAEEALHLANAELERSLRLKDEFLANMSHELRTPLNAILGITESLLEQISGTLNAKQQKYLQTVLESAQHLLELINDILDLAKINAGRIELDMDKVDIASAVHSSMRMVRELAHKKGLNVQLTLDPGVKLVWADERRLKQMLVNLLSNSVKFTLSGGQIGLDVRGDRENQTLLFTVWDTGIGIRKEDLHLLFRPFVQLDAGLARGSQGTGLGLVLVSQMARLHGGSVGVESEFGKGSRFTIAIPWVEVGKTGSLDQKSTTPYTPDLRPSEKPYTILVVEDTEAVIMLIRDYLEQHGYQVITAQDGFEGLECVGKYNPDLILMDVMMPNMDGLETTRRIRQQPGSANTPIIAITALAMAGDRERCLAAGMNDYLSKPVKLKELLDTIKRHLEITKEGDQ